MTFSIKDFFNKWDQICSFLCIWSHLLKKSLMENFIFCVVEGVFRVLSNVCLRRLFCEEIPSQMHDKVLNTPLRLFFLSFMELNKAPNQN